MNNGKENISKNTVADAQKGKEFEVAQNPNPRANENVRERTANDPAPAPEQTDNVGSEITDGEDA